MASIKREDIARYLRAEPGTRVLREIREDLVKKGVALDEVVPKPTASVDLEKLDQASPQAALEGYMTAVAGSDQYDLSTVPLYLAGATTRYFAAAARPDGTIDAESVGKTLGPKAKSLFGLLSSEIENRNRPGRNGSRDRSASQGAKRSFPQNMIGADVRLADRGALRIPSALLRRRKAPGLMRLGGHERAEEVVSQIAARDERRSPARRIAQFLGKPMPSPSIAGLEPLKDKARKERPFEGAKLLVLQHLYASTQSVLDAAVEGGLDPKDVTVMGKPYSGSMQVAASLVDRGFQLVVPSLVQSEFSDHEAHMEAVLGAQLERLISDTKGTTKPILVLDDGGLVAKMVKHRFPEEMSRFRFVEQTQRGANVIKELGSIEAPVVNVAESWAKKKYESPSIAHSVWKEVSGTLSRLEGQGVTVTKSVTILGFGAIGSSVAKKFKEAGFGVHVYDPDPVRQKEAKAAGFDVHTSKTEALTHGHVVVGASGREAIKLDDFAALPKSAILFNAASANNEVNATNQLTLQFLNGNPLNALPRESPNGDGIVLMRQSLYSLDTSVLDEDKKLWDLFQGKNVCLGKDESATQIDRVVHTADAKSLYFAHSGFVINLTDENDPIPPRYIGLTRSLLFAALTQTAKETRKGLVELDPKTQEEIVERTQAELAKTSESLLDPRF
ncbi:MAG: hypothetical protein HYV07_18420 [Deltaproteobacteria bacterium]|nr:hypothetical protein [Deltaproteobacteria bacterium]